MKIYFTEEISIEVERKIQDIVHVGRQVLEEFSDKFYGEDLETIYISLICISPKFEPFFKARRPNYKSEHRVYIHRGIEIEREGKSLTYDLRLNYGLYASTEDIKRILAHDILQSLDVIKTVKKIKGFDVDKFKRDFELFFQRIKLM